MNKMYAQKLFKIRFLKTKCCNNLTFLRNLRPNFKAILYSCSETQFNFDNTKP